VTCVKIVIENFFPEVYKMLPEMEDRGQHFTKEKNSIMIDDASCCLFCCTSVQNVCYFTPPLNKVNKQHGCLLILYDVRFSHSNEFGVGMVINVLNINEA